MRMAQIRIQAKRRQRDNFQSGDPIPSSIVSAVFITSSLEKYQFVHTISISSKYRLIYLK